MSTTRCHAAYPHDPSACDGPLDAVMILDRASDTSILACVHHAALLLAFVKSSSAHSHTVAGAALDAVSRAFLPHYRRWSTAIHRRVPLREFIRLFVGEAA